MAWVRGSAGRSSTWMGPLLWGGGALPGAAEAVARLRKGDVALRFTTNTLAARAPRWPRRSSGPA